MKILSTAEAAEKLNVSAIRIRQMIRGEKLPAQKVGRDYIIFEKDLDSVVRRPAGRPARTKE